MKRIRFAKYNVATTRYTAGLMTGAALITCVLYSWAVPLPYYDGFDYAEGRLNDVGAPNWQAGSTGWELMVTNVAALEAPEGFPLAVGKGVRRAPSGTARRSVLAFDPIQAADGNEVYASFLIKILVPPPSTQLIAYLTSTSGSESSPQAGVFLTPDNRIGIGKRASSPGYTLATNLDSGVHLIVFRYRFQPGNDEVSLWVDPPIFTFGASVPPDPLGTTTGGSDPSSIGYFQLYSSPSSGGMQYIDELRVGTSWRDVVPSGAPPVGSKLIFSSCPTWAKPGQILDPVIVQIASSSGTPVSSNGVPITIDIEEGPGPLSGTLTRLTDESGKAVFTDLMLPVEGIYRLRAEASGIGLGLGAATSPLIQVSFLEPPTTLTITDWIYDKKGYVLAGVKGTPQARYNILASPDPAIPLSNWMVATVGDFDSLGNFRITNPVSPAIARMFYAIIGPTSNTKTIPPSIVASPSHITIAPGQPFSLQVQATGPYLHYLWLKDGQILLDKTEPSLNIEAAKSTDAGDYAVIVANAAGATTSTWARVRVGLFAPEIIVQPQDQQIVQGGTAVFKVVADGTSPLWFQWYFNGVAIVGATNDVLTLTNVLPERSGEYWVIVSNSLGSVASRSALLTVTEIPTASPPTNMVGFAAIAGVTGGAGGSEVIATNYTQLRTYCRSNAPLIIKVVGRIEANEDYCYVRAPNKTIIGVGTNAEFVGDLRINTTNVIVANITFYSPNNDGITIDTGSSGTGAYVWVDHCTFVDCGDGSIDITKGADYVTVSWCKFLYPTRRTHAYVNLLGSSDSETESIGKLHVTFCYNWYGPGCMERMPSVRFGKVHVFNNYYDCPGNNYCVRTRLYAEVLVENNYFQSVQNPWERYVTSGPSGLLRAIGNITNNCVWNPSWYPGVELIPGTDYLPSFDPMPYTYTLLPAEWVPYYVTRYAGAGKPPYVEE